MQRLFFGKGPRVVVQGRAKRGLFAGKHIKFGNRVAESKAKTRRTWKPNVIQKKFYSDILERELKVIHLKMKREIGKTRKDRSVDFSLCKNGSR